MQRYDYLLSALPGLEPLGAVPPMTKQEFMEKVRESRGPSQSIEMIMLSDDLMQAEALDAGEVEQDQLDLVVLSVASADESVALPAALCTETGDSQENARQAVDQLWQRYFVHAGKTAKKCHSRFLKAWVGYEVALRNALVTARAQALDLDPTHYWVATDWADTDLDFSGTLTAWSAAAHPLAGLEVLDKARWDWLEEQGQWFSFAADELEAYAAKLMLLHRWRRLTAESTA